MPTLIGLYEEDNLLFFMAEQKIFLFNVVLFADQSKIDNLKDNDLNLHKINKCKAQV